MGDSTGPAEVGPKPKPALVRLGGAQNGRPAGGPGRLTTFRPPRDLTLGSPKVAAEKKKFVPNLNVARVKKEADDSQAGIKKEHGRRGKKEKKERERKERPGLIQTMGSIFAEGVGAGSTGIRRRAGGGGGGRGEGEGRAAGPGLESGGGGLDTEEEEARLKELLRDDFIDDLTSGGFVPVQLPMVDTGKIFKEEVKKEVGEELKPRLHHRRQPAELDSDDDEPDDIKPDIKPSVRPPAAAPQVSIADLVKAQKGDLLFIQLPDSLPGPAVKRPDGAAVCDLASLPEGCLGKLQIRRSGACQLLLGENQVMDVEMGTRAGFLQDAVSLRLPGPVAQQGDLTVLGHVRHKLVVTPAWDSLLGRADLQPGLA